MGGMSISPSKKDGVKIMANTSLQIEITALDKASKQLDRIGKSLNPLNNKVKKLDSNFDKVNDSIKRSGSSLKKFVAVAAGALAAGGIVAFGKSVIDAFTSVEDLRFQLEASTGSAAKGEAAFNKLNKMSKTSIFTIDQLSEAYSSLATAGLKPNEKMLTLFGDTAAVAKDNIRAFEAITKLWARGALGGIEITDIEMLEDAGIPVFRILNEEIKELGGNSRKNITEFSRSASGAQRVLTTLEKAWAKMFGGLQIKAMDKLSVALRKLSESWTMFQAGVGEGGFARAIHRASSRLRDFIDNNQEAAKALGENLGKVVDKVTDAFINFAANADIDDIIQKINSGFEQLIETARTMGRVFKGIEGALEWLGVLDDGSRPELKKLMDPRTATSVGKVSMGAGGNANATVNYNIASVNAGGGMGQFQSRQMEDYIKGLALQASYETSRRNNRFGGLA